MTSRMNPALSKARQAVAEARTAVAEDEAAVAKVQSEIAALQSQINTMRARAAAEGLRAKLAAAERDLADAEEVAVKSLAIELAGEIVKKQAADPVRHSDWIVAQIERLRSMVRSGIDTPISEKYSQHPAITQALALLPPPDGLDVPVFELGYQVSGTTDWPTRRRAILAAAEQQAA
jgi:hypothetical protein